MIEALAGLIAGTISATGMGGGTILILILTMFLGIEQHSAQAINLVFFIPTAIVAIVINIKNRNIDFKASKLVICFGIIGAALRFLAINYNFTRELKVVFWNILSIYCTK